MKKNIFLLLVLIITIFIASCSKKSITPKTTPIIPPVTINPPIDGNLLIGWWAPIISNRYNLNIYFGSDHFNYLDSVNKIIPPATGFWRINQDSIYLSPFPNEYAALVYSVSKLTKDSLVFSINGSNITGPQRFYKINRSAITSAAISTIAGSSASNIEDGIPAVQASIYGSGGIINDSQGNIYFCDRENAKIEKITASDGIIHTIAGTGSRNPKPFVNNIPALSADLVGPTFLAMDASGNIYVSEGNSEKDFANRVDRISAANGTITCVAGSLTNASGFSGDNGPASVAILNKPQGIAIDAAGNLYIADEQNNRIREVLATDGKIKTIAGTGNSGYAGDGGPAISANISVRDISLDAAGNIYFSDFLHHCIRKITTSTGIITTIAGTGLPGNGGDGGPAISALLNSPYGVKAGANGTIYFSETGNYDVRKIDGNTGIISRVGGNGFRGYIGDGIHATAYSFLNPCGITVDILGNVYINDAFRIRKIAAH